ncbi:MAG: hypothetical protein CFE45_14140, partial [Burkholderiales bacterium PBB5]
LAERLAASPDTQRLLCYDPGVGNPGELPGATTWDQLQRRLERIGGLAFGRGVFENMAESYLFLMRNYREGDQIYIFGFSRGAFTARSVAGLINLFGILPAQLESMVPTLLHVYFSSRDDDGAWQAIAAQVLRVFGSAPQRPNVHFIGVWDTVASVGMPPFGARFTALPQPENKRYLHIRQALALDEHRSQFEPRLYARNNGPFTTADGSTGSLVQLWFPGAHCDVGGAYLPAESVLSDNALAWMTSEAVGQGLRLHHQGAPLDSEPAVHRALAQVLQQDAGPREAQAHSEVLDTPLWALTGLTVRDTTQVHLDDGGTVPLQAVAHQPAGAVHAGHQRGHRGLALAVIGCPLQHLGLQLQRGERAAQLVRGIGDEGALAFQRLAQPAQQRVQALHQRRHLVGQLRFGQRLQGRCVTLAHMGRPARQGPQCAGDQPPQRRGQQRRGGQQRQHAAQRGVGGQVLADAQWLGHLDHAVARGHGKAAPALAAVGLDVGKAQDGTAGQGLVGAAGVDAAAVDAPDLHHEVQVLVVEGRRLAGRDLALVTQAQRHLAQLVVKQRLRLQQHVAVGDAAYQQRGQRQRAQQRQRQPRPDRLPDHADAAPPAGPRK